MILVISEELMGVSGLLNRINILETTTINGFTVYKVRIENSEPFLIAITGYGKVNTARAIQYIDDMYCIDRIIVTGNAASLDTTTAAIGSVGVSTSSTQYDVNYTPIGAGAYEFPNQEENVYPANTYLINLATNASLGANVASNQGIFASADQFLATTTTASSINTNTGALFADSNTGDVGQVAYFNRIPYVSVKGVSNTGGDAAATEYNANSMTANRNANEVVYRMLLTLLQVTPIVEDDASPRCNQQTTTNQQASSQPRVNQCYNNCNRFWWGF